MQQQETFADVAFGTLTVSSSPHIKEGTTTASIMRDVLIALTPALLWGVYVFGLNALLMPLIGTVGFYLFHWCAAYLIPCLLFVTHGISNILAFVRNTGHLALTELMLYIGAYCVYALFGVVVTGLLCYVFGKEDGK